MRKLYSLLWLCSLTCRADPFYAEEPLPIVHTIAKNSENLTACLPPNGVHPQYVTVPFAQLKLVGIIQFKEKFTALFEDQDHQLIDLTLNDLLVHEQIQVEQINLKQVWLIDWQHSDNCQQPKRIQLKL